MEGYNLYCQNCGKQISDNAVFCGYCGSATPVTDDDVNYGGMTETKDSSMTFAKKNKKQKLRKTKNMTKTVFFIIFALILAISGVSSGYFVAKNGWYYKTWGVRQNSGDTSSYEISDINNETYDSESTEEKEKPVNESSTTESDENPATSETVVSGLSYAQIS